MGALIFGSCFALFFAVVPLLGARRQAAMVEKADDEQLVGLRTMAESRWTEYLLAVWSLLSVVGAVFLIIRGHGTGWGWLIVAAVYAAGIVTGRRNRRRLLRALGDRGRVERSQRYLARASTSYTFVAVGVTGYIGTKIVGYAYPDQMPTGAEVVNALMALVLIVGAVGFFAVRARMYWSGDDLTDGTS